MLDRPRRQHAQRDRPVHAARPAKPIIRWQVESLADQVSINTALRKHFTQTRDSAEECIRCCGRIAPQKCRMTSASLSNSTPPSLPFPSPRRAAPNPWQVKLQQHLTRAADLPAAEAPRPAKVSAAGAALSWSLPSPLWLFSRNPNFAGETMCW